MTRTGVFTISLDLELYWGVRDNRTIEGYGDHLRGVPRAVDAMLDLFREFDVHATWAAVGLLFFRDEHEARASLPALRPAYVDARYSPYADLERGDLERAVHFAPDLIARVRGVRGQEIGTHTFSHFYGLEEGATEDAFRADLEHAIHVSRQHGVDPASIVFPRNQFSAAHLAILRDCGIRCYRGNEPHPLYDFTEQARNTRYKRILRIVDAYANLTGDHLFDLPDASAQALPVNVPASRFLRPVDRRFAWLEGLRLARIRRSLDRAAAQGRGFHLWWHPHNFGAAPESNLRFLRSIVEHFARLRDRQGMRSLNMGEVAALRHEVAPVAEAARRALVPA